MTAMTKNEPSIGKDIQVARQVAGTPRMGRARTTRGRKSK